ncbi:MAG: hypothetical protein IK031_02610 [Bacteroidales bacterium]|nr:hypothetical protein [Bacteroidales bacterium]
MIIVVEAGATKSDWRVLDSGSERRMLLPGINVSTIAMEQNLSTIGSGLLQAGAPQLDGFYLYTAGIVTPEIRQTVSAHVRSIVSTGDIEVHDDLVAAARAVCGRNSGIVAMLGTGSNACSWDGERVSFKARSGGYILGDEGGGAALGKRFLADLIKGLVPDAVATEFGKSYDASYEGIVQGVYRSPAPAAYLGSFAPWLLERYSDPYVKSLIDGNFRSFIERLLLRYDTSSAKVGVVGGWGFACKDIFRALCSGYGIETGEFVPEPVSGLVRFHLVQQ